MTPRTTSTIRPCPFCASRQVGTVLEAPAYNRHARPKWYVACAKCQAHGPANDAQDPGQGAMIARSRWNHRSRKATPTQGAPH